MTKEKIPVWAGNFVVADYGSGMVMAVPAHDQRDFEFAEKYEIPIKIVIQPEKHLAPERMTGAYTGSGKLINSENFDGLFNDEAKEHIAIYLKEKKLGKKVVNYKLRDWLISRQRYWGTPIPVVYCDKCGIVPVPEKDLPIKLPKEVEFGKGNPLATNDKWMNVKCPKCGGKGRRETDTMDTFVNSSWYYLRYSDSHNSEKIFDVKKANYWAPIDQYIGGPEHITMHLIYMRFYTKFLKDLGLLKFEEPALRYFTQGIVHASDGEKMSKSKGNVIEPLNVIKKYGADSLRLFLVSIASPDKDFNWDDKGIQGTFNFINKVYSYFEEFKSIKVSPKIESKLNKTIKEVTDYVQNFKHNLAVIKIRSLFENFIVGEVDRKSAEAFLKLLHIYCPFVTEELWERLGNKTFISLEKWPIAEEKKIDEKLE
jgi:leucyl-tRNA synthetase